MRYWYDFEFVESGVDTPILPISLGIVAEDGRELYRQFPDNLPHALLNPWIRKYVMPGMKHMTWDEKGGGKLRMCDMREHTGKTPEGQDWKPEECPWIYHTEMALELALFFDVAKYGKPEIWGYYADYDHVCYAQIFGAMIALPKGFPMLTLDIKQELIMQAVRSGEPELRIPKQAPEEEHNALNDARWNKLAWELLFPGGLPSLR